MVDVWDPDFYLPAVENLYCGSKGEKPELKATAGSASRSGWSLTN
jgi:hypothetical protein